MPSIWSFTPEHTSGIDLSTNKYWRLAMSATQVHGKLWLAAVAIYPPTPPATLETSQIVLCRSEVSVAQSIAEVQKLATRCASTGSYDEDLKRMTEAFNMFKNSPGVKQDAIDTCVKDATEVLKAFWQIRSWLMGGALAVEEVTNVPYFHIRGNP